MSWVAVDLNGNAKIALFATQGAAEAAQARVFVNGQHDDADRDPKLRQRIIDGEISVSDVKRDRRGGTIRWDIPRQISGKWVIWVPGDEARLDQRDELTGETIERPAPEWVGAVPAGDGAELVSSFFDEEIAEVDPGKALSLVIDPTYAPFEWSYDGLEVKGGSRFGCEYGASELLYQMGFRWYTPNLEFWVRPTRIRTDLTASKQSFWIPNNSIWLVYGHSWGGDQIASRTLLNGAMAKWQRLHGLGESAFPAGHRWSKVIAAGPAFFADNPQMLRTPAAFDLVGISGTADWDKLVHFCAAYLLSEGLNEFNRTHFDPSDGDSNPSDMVFPFTKAVADLMRAGTDPIGPFPAQQGVPDAQLGIYAYAGHSLPPTESVRPSVYTQVALAFNQTVLTFQELVEGHGAKAEHIMLREYLDTQLWSHGAPHVMGTMRKGYFERYDAFQAAGAIGMNAEFAANWLVNMVATHYGIRYLRTGAGTYDDALAEIVENIFGGDLAVAALYEYWSSHRTHDKYSLKRSTDIIDSMSDGWYKTYYQQLAVILYKHLFLPPQIPPEEQDETDSFPAAFSSLMANVVAVRDSDITHSYAWLRRLANSAVATNYPHLWMAADPPPDYLVAPAPPTESEFDDTRAALEVAAYRDPDLDSNDLVLATMPGEPDPDGSATNAVGVCEFRFVGPGIVTVDGVATEYGPGLHSFEVLSSIVSHEGGALFLLGFPRMQKYPYSEDGAAHHYIYVPNRLAGEVKIEAINSRITIIDDGVRLDIGPGTDTSDVGPGLVMIHNFLTRGLQTYANVNKYISTRSDVMLMPRVFAVEDGLQFDSVSE